MYSDGNGMPPHTLSYRWSYSRNHFRGTWVYPAHGRLRFGAKITWNSPTFLSKQKRFITTHTGSRFSTSVTRGGSMTYI